MTAGSRAFHLTIEGRVQGVGFRESMRDLALTLNVVGWVCNRVDGCVEAFMQGDEEPLERLIIWAHRGPPGANVTGVSAREVEPDTSLLTFARKPTI